MLCLFFFYLYITCLQNQETSTATGDYHLEITFSVDAEIYGAAVADTSMVFVIDRSGSTCDNPNQGCASDENYDLQFDDTLDCEIAAVLDLVSKVRDEGTVSHIGLVSFSHKLGLDIDTATIELPLTDINIPTSSTLHAIENSIRDVNCGGATNYAAAVEKACEVMESSTTALNIVIFISDGLPTRGGSPAAYCNNEAIFHALPHQVIQVHYHQICHHQYQVQHHHPLHLPCQVIVQVQSVGGGVVRDFRGNHGAVGVR